MRLTARSKSVRLELRVLKRASTELKPVSELRPQMARQRRVRLDDDERVGSELEQPSVSPVRFPGRPRATLVRARRPHRSTSTS